MCGTKPELMHDDEGRVDHTTVRAALTFVPHCGRMGAVQVGALVPRAL